MISSSLYLTGGGAVDISVLKSSSCHVFYVFNILLDESDFKVLCDGKESTPLKVCENVSQSSNNHQIFIKLTSMIRCFVFVSIKQLVLSKISKKTAPAILKEKQQRLWNSK
ncbi:hypothetical protein RYX36_028561 [Vicia faba]